MSVIGHNNAEELLYGSNLNTARSFLIEGPRGVGKALLAQNFAGHILGSSDRVKNRSHSDFLLIEKRTDEEKGSKKEIVAEDAKKLRGFLELTPAEGKHRVAIIDSADELNNQAANSILKMVEEPPRNSIIILLSHGGHVLPTIRSRCLTIKLQSLPHEEMKQVVSQIMVNITESDLELLTDLSEGSPGMAKMLYENEGLWLLDNLVEIINFYPKYDYLNLTKFAEKAMKAEKGWEAFCYILSWLLTSIAKGYATGRQVTVRGTQLDPNVNLSLLLDDIERWNKIVDETDIFNLEKKQIVVNQLSAFAECFY